MDDIKQTIADILESAKNLYDRQDVCKMIILALVADESIFLYGPPGTAKSMIAKWAASVLNTDKYFSCLLNQYTQPDELFGPVSIKALEEGRRELMTEGYMPEAEITFLDEIWKAGPAILNTLLTICNEKKFKNGNKTLDVPLKLLLSASNEFPEEGSGLSALYDRFLIRLEVTPIANRKDFHRLMTDVSDNQLTEFEPLSNEELNIWNENAELVLIPEGIFNFIYVLRSELKKHEIYISDRRWKKIVKLMKCSAFLNGRNQINVSDFFIFDFTLWSKLEDKKIIEECIKIVFSDYGIDIREKNFVKEIESKIAKIENEISIPDSDFNAIRFSQSLDDLQKEIDNLPKVAREYCKHKFENILKPKKPYIERAANSEINKQVSDYISEKKEYLEKLNKKITGESDSGELVLPFTDKMNEVFSITNNYRPYHEGWENEKIKITKNGSERGITLESYRLELDKLRHDMEAFFLLKGERITGNYPQIAAQFLEYNSSFFNLPIPARIFGYLDDGKRKRIDKEFAFLDYLLFCNPDSSTAFVIDMEFILFRDDYKEWKEYLDSIDFWKRAYGRNTE